MDITIYSVQNKRYSEQFCGNILKTDKMNNFFKWHQKLTQEEIEN